MLNNKGFFLLDLLLSLSILIMIGLFFTPVVMNLSIQSQQLKAENVAFQLLYEELDKFIINGHTSPDYSTKENGIDFLIHWKENSDSLQKVVCVTIEKNSFISDTEICATNE
ncbi:MAG: hypothetical protein Q8934_11600 [Bacillota bacterium]|nr:hypothetical protein [Bacillota bacterium]